MKLSLNEFVEEMKEENYEEINILLNQSFIDTSIFKENDSSVVLFDKIVPKGKMISIRKHTRYIHYPIHKHDYIELNYVLSGKSNQIIENKKTTLTKGDLLFLGTGTTHEILPSMKEDILLNFIIHKKFFNYIFEFIDEETSLSSFFTDIIFRGFSPKAFIYKTSSNQVLEELMNKIIYELRGNENLREAKLKFLLGLLVIELIKQHPIELIGNTYEKDLLFKVVSYIETNLKAASLNELSLQLNLKYYNLSKLIKKESGLTFNNLVRNIRLEKFCELVKVRNISINDLAVEVGFSNTSNFYRFFKEKYGISPKKFKNLNS